MVRLPALLLLASSTASAHFAIKYPTQNSPISENDLNKGPCGGAVLDFDDKPVSDFHVAGEAVLLEPTHPQQNWLFRVTLDETGASNWTRVFPIVQQSGMGYYCNPELTAPEEYVGKRGLLGVVASAEDGILFGCSQVKFVEGKADRPNDCRNTTRDFSFVSDTGLEALVGDNSGPSDDKNNGDNGNKDESKNNDKSAAQLLAPTSWSVTLALAAAGFARLM